MFHRRLTGVIAIAASIAGFTIVSPTAEAADAAALPVVLDLDSPGTPTDSGGIPLAIVSDSVSDATRTIDAAASDGTPVRIDYYLGDPELPELDQLQARQAQVRPGVGAGEPALVTGSLAADNYPSASNLIPIEGIAATPTAISFAWRAPSVANQFEILIDGTSQGTSNTPYFALPNLEPDTEYEIRALSLEVRPPAAPNAPDVNRTAPYSSQTIVEVRTLPIPSSARESQRLSTGDGEVQSTEVNYRTFIPYARLADSPNSEDASLEQTCLRVWAAGQGELPLQDRYTFAGDNRTFAPPSSARDYRTMMSARYDWEKREWNHRKGAGLTRVLFQSDGTERAKDSADTLGMQFRLVASSDNYSKIIFDHIANDPFCFSYQYLGAIAYSASFEVYKSGLVRMVGSYVRMPSHETWVRWNDQREWSSLFQADAKNLLCLAIQVTEGCWAYTESSADRVIDTNVDFTPQRGSGAPFTLNEGHVSNKKLSFRLEDDDLPKVEALIPGSTGSYQLVPDWNADPIAANLNGFREAALADGWQPGRSVEYSGPDITEVRAWVGRREIPIGQEGWSVRLLNGAFQLSASDVSVLDEPANTTGRRLFTNGYITFKVKNSAVNTISIVNPDAPRQVFREEHDTSADFDAKSWPATAVFNRLSMNSAGTGVSILNLEESWSPGGVRPADLRSLPYSVANPGSSSVNFENLSLETSDGRKFAVVDRNYPGMPADYPHGTLFMRWDGDRLRSASIHADWYFDLGTTDANALRGLLDGASIVFEIEGEEHRIRYNTHGYRDYDALFLKY